MYSVILVGKRRAACCFAPAKPILYISVTNIDVATAADMMMMMMVV